MKAPQHYFSTPTSNPGDPIESILVAVHDLQKLITDLPQRFNASLFNSAKYVNGSREIMLQVPEGPLAVALTKFPSVELDDYNTNPFNAPDQILALLESVSVAFSDMQKNRDIEASDILDHYSVIQDYVYALSRLIASFGSHCAPDSVVGFVQRDNLSRATYALNLNFQISQSYPEIHRAVQELTCLATVLDASHVCDTNHESGPDFFWPSDPQVFIDRLTEFVEAKKRAVNYLKAFPVSAKRAKALADDYKDFYGVPVREVIHHDNAEPIISFEERELAKIKIAVDHVLDSSSDDFSFDEWLLNFKAINQGKRMAVIKDLFASVLHKGKCPGFYFDLLMQFSVAEEIIEEDEAAEIVGMKQNKYAAVQSPDFLAKFVSKILVIKNDTRTVSEFLLDQDSGL